MRNLIYSGNSLFGRCLSLGLTGQPGVAFVRHSSDLDEIVDLAQRHHATSVLVDLGDETGPQAVTTLSHALPGTCLVALSVDDRVASAVIECARLGCHGIVPRDAEIEDVLRIVRAAEGGEVMMRPSAVAHLMQAWAGEDACTSQELPECLTRREKEICELVCEGLTNKEIAREANLSIGTVKNHVRSILSKLEIPRRGAIHSNLHKARAR